MPTARKNGKHKCQLHRVSMGTDVYEKYADGYFRRQEDWYTAQLIEDQ